MGIKITFHRIILITKSRIHRITLYKTEDSIRHTIILNPCIHHFDTFPLRMSDVEQNTCRICPWISITMITNPFCCRKFYFYIIIRQHHFIISRSSLFRSFIKARTITSIRLFQCARHCFQSACSRHRYHTSYLKLVKMGKSLNRSMPIIISIR